jgi:hypothetical protein
LQEFLLAVDENGRLKVEIFCYSLDEKRNTWPVVLKTQGARIGHISKYKNDFGHDNTPMVYEYAEDKVVVSTL